MRQITLLILLLAGVAVVGCGKYDPQLIPGNKMPDKHKTYLLAANKDSTKWLYLTGSGIYSTPYQIECHNDTIVKITIQPF